MAQRSSLARRLRAIEADRGLGVQKHPMAMTDDELWRALDIRDPATGALRKDLTDEELKDLVRQAWERGQAAKLGLE